MKITKFVHSCLLIEENKTVLIDPGFYSTKLLASVSLPKLDYLLITHEHPDHLDTNYVLSLVKKFPSLEIFTNNSVLKILENGGLKPKTGGNQDISQRSVPHEKVFGTQPPENVLFEMMGKLTHPGDSFHFSLNTPILALPLQAPWGSLTEAVNLAEDLKPEVVVPIHDWHWNNEAKSSLYQRLEAYFHKQGIKFVPLEDGKVAVIN